MIEIKQKIKKAIKEHGYIIIRIDSKKILKNNDLAINYISFTVGMSKNYGGPELIFVGEREKDISRFLDKYIFYKKIDITTKEIVSFTNLGDENAKHGIVEHHIANKFASQLFEYYKEEYPERKPPEVIWIGRKTKNYPFHNFLNGSNDINLEKIVSNSIN